MKILKCLVLDDEQASINSLARLIDSRDDLQLAAGLENPMEALEIIAETDIELLFIDLHMDLMHGVEVIKRLQGKIEVVCVSAHNNYGPQLSELDVAYYLEKPISKEKFNRAIDRVWSRITGVSAANSQARTRPLDLDDTVMVKLPGKINFHQVRLLEIELILVEDNVTKILITEGKIEVTYGIGDLELKLPASHYMRIHKGFIVPLDRIRSYTAKEGIKLRTSNYSAFVPVGRKYKDKLEAFIDNRERFRKF